LATGTSTLFIAALQQFNCRLSVMLTGQEGLVAYVRELHPVQEGDAVVFQ
jgi:hypothetical protein